MPYQYTQVRRSVLQYGQCTLYPDNELAHAFPDVYRDSTRRVLI
jgi:hypothetical protein